MDECGTKPKEEEVLDVALAGLHNRHSVLRTVLESDSSATMATALPRLMKEEQSVWGQHEEVAMFVGGGRGAGGGRSEVRGGGLGRGRQLSVQRVFQRVPTAQRGGGRSGVGGGRGRAVAGWNGVLKPNIECFGCHQFGHF